MRISTRVAILSTAFLLLASASQAQTQAASPFGNRAANQESAPQDMYQPPAVFVTGAQVQIVNNQVQGSFEILNNDQETVGDIHYRLDLLAPLPASEANQLVQDTAETYDSVVSTELFAVIPGERKVVPFTYTPPRVPKGDYRLRIQLVTSKGRELGWHDAPVNLGVEGANFVRIVPGTIALPEFPEELIPPESGPNVAPGSSFTVHATFQNIGKETVTARPVLERYVFDIARGREEKIVLGEPVTLAAGESKEVSFSVTAPAEPEVYVGIVSLEDPATNTRISNWAEYRWVVRGLDADIVSARIAALHQLSGEIVDVQVDYVGPADAETATRGQLLVELTDIQGTVGSVKVPDIELTDALQSGMARVILERDVAGSLGIKVTLSDQAGNVLDTYEVPVPLSEAQIGQLLGQPPLAAEKQKVPVGVWVGSGIAGAGIVVLLIWAVTASMRNRRPSIPGGPLAVIAILGGLAVGGVSLATNGITVQLTGPSLAQFCAAHGGEWCNLGSGYISELFINSPIHQNTYTTPGAIPVSYRVDFIACQNHWYYSRNVIRYSPEGATHSSWQPPAGTSWHNIVEVLFSGGGSECRRYFCRLTRYYSATLNLSQLPTTYPATTLQIMAVRGGYTFGAPPPWNESLYTTYSTWPLFTHAVNLWLKFPTPTPTPTIPPIYQCNNTVDDLDPEDALIDAADPGCHTDRNVNNPASYVPTDNDEGNPPVCSDEIDNDGDNRIDSGDPACHPSDLNETNSASYVPTHFTEVDTQCSDKKDNDGDQKADIADPGCHTDGNPDNPTSYDPKDDDEADPVCSDGKDNDNDKRIDKDDPACHTDHQLNKTYLPLHTSEVDAECSDTQDNLDPEDSLIDAADPGCHTDRDADNAASYVPADNSELDSTPDITPTPATKPAQVIEVD